MVLSPLGRRTHRIEIPCVILRGECFQNDKSDIEKVKHEWGHFAQLALHGPAAFTLFIAIPSVIYNLHCQKTGDWGNYYKVPWERYADFLGGAKH